MDLEQLKTRAKKANAAATQWKMNLHDLSEELPTNWEQIMEVARRCHDAHQQLVEARAALSAATATGG